MIFNKFGEQSQCYLFSTGCEKRDGSQAIQAENHAELQ
jgi:hypothetical protein